jgi:hypothetical protein
MMTMAACAISVLALQHKQGAAPQIARQGSALAGFGEEPRAWGAVITDQSVGLSPPFRTRRWC